MDTKTWADFKLKSTFRTGTNRLRIKLFNRLFKGTFAFIVLMRTQEDNPGKAAVATVKVLFFKNVRLLSMRDHHCNVIRAKMKDAIITTDLCR